MSDPYADDDDIRRSGPPIAVLAGLAVLGLTLAAAASAWMAMAFSGRQKADVELYRAPKEVGLIAPGELDTFARYADSFVRDAFLPLGIATAVCAVLFVAWHAAADTAARTEGGGLNQPRGLALGGWFVPIANLVIPLRALRELTEVHRAWIAFTTVLVWWAPWLVCLVLGTFAINTTFTWSPFNSGRLSEVELVALDKYGVIVGGGLAISALAMIVVVLNTTAAIRGRYGEVSGTT